LLELSEMHPRELSLCCLATVRVCASCMRSVQEIRATGADDLRRKKANNMGWVHGKRVRRRGGHNSN
jgi:hypothetical protein